jgi:3-methyladenine DNA glycosylase AlkD
MQKEMDAIIGEIRDELKKNIDNEVVTTGANFFKEEVKILGVKSIDVKNISKTFFKRIKNCSVGDILYLCENLFRSGYNEEAFVACHISYGIHKQYTPNIFKTFETWVNNYVTNWAVCDTLCNHTIGSFIEMYPTFIEKLKNWASQENRWVRRAAAVSLIIPARKGLFLHDILEIADILLLDKDDLVQKGYGWMMKTESLCETFVKKDDETKKHHLQTIFDYVMKNKNIMPRTALRYAIEKMPQEMKIQAMKR